LSAEELNDTMPIEVEAPDRPMARPRIAGIAAAATRTTLGLLLLAMVLLNVLNAVFRYLFGLVLIGADELLVFAMIWMVMIGIILATLDRRHIALDLLAARLPPRARLGLAMLHNSLIAVAGGYASVQCFEFTRRVAAIGQTSMALGFPMAIPHSALVVGFAGTALVAALLVVSDGIELLASRRTAEKSAP
jgi:TRAP-type C4-dicarboxylate transport system permease small subunit